MSPAESQLYRLDLDWTGGRKGLVSGFELPPVDVAPPPEFAGPRGVWSPEHFLVAASASCLLLTFAGIAERSKLPLNSFHLEAQGRLDNIPGEGFRFTEITLIAEIGVAESNIELARRVLEKAEKNCLITKSLNAAVHVEPRFVSEPVEAIR